MVKVTKGMRLDCVVFIQDGIRYNYWKKTKQCGIVMIYINVEGTPFYSETTIERQ